LVSFFSLFDNDTEFCKELDVFLQTAVNCHLDTTWRPSVTAVPITKLD